MDEFNPAYGMTKAILDSVKGEIGQKISGTFGQMYDYVIDPLHFKMKKTKFHRELDFQKYQQEVLSEMNKIPLDELQEPSLSIVGPALEASKYYINDDEVRNMFSKLLAKSMHKGYSKMINHSFVEVIKQLSPLDVKLFSYIYKREYVATAKIVATFDNYEGVPLTDYYFVDFENDVDIISLSLNNLNRLGLLNFPEYAPLFPDKLYQEFYITEPYKSLRTNNEFQRLSKNFNKALDVNGRNLYNVALENSIGIQEVERFKKYSGIELIKTNTSLSTYGKALAVVCLNN